MIMTNLEKANQVSQELTGQELVGLALQNLRCCTHPEHLCGLGVCPQN